jgi:predicted RNase H-like HicB family nuclease
MASRGVAVKPTAVSEEMARLRVQVEELRRDTRERDQEIEQLERTLFTQEFHVIDGYVVAVWPDDDGTFMATCPKLGATAQEDSKEEALRIVGEAMDVAREGMAYFGDLLPPRDFE